ncbi:MAG: hypothetical protein AAF512_12195 [Pseudomonadota bacterium]
MGLPLRANHVGSLLRPQKIARARETYGASQINKNGFTTHPELQQIEDASIAEAVRMQESVGLQAVTDGEYRRSFWHYDFMGALHGLELVERDAGYSFTVRP